MSIAIVQIGAGASAAGVSLSISITATGVTAGNTLFLIEGHTDEVDTSPTVTVSDAQGTYNPDITLADPDINIGIYSLFNANAGNHTITAVAHSGTAANSQWGVNWIEVSGLGTTSTLDKSGSKDGASGGGAAKTPTTATTSALATASELVLVGVTGDGGLAGGTFPPTGGNNAPYISIYNKPSTQAYVDFDYQINTSVTTGVAASWGTTTVGNNWATVIATYKAAAAAITGNLLIQSNQGGF